MKRIYTFGNGQAEGRADMKNLLGGKGANLAEMNLIGVPVPPGFTITTEVCTEYNTLGREAVVKILEEDVKKSVAHIEKLTGNTFGDAVNPLLVSVRSGARADSGSIDRFRRPAPAPARYTPKNPWQAAPSFLNIVYCIIVSSEIQVLEIYILYC